MVYFLDTRMDVTAKTTISRWREVEEDESEDDGEVKGAVYGR
jgi:hypothetical protein